MITAYCSGALSAFPSLTVSTPRLVVRPLAGDDAEPVAVVFADRKTKRWIPVPGEYDQADALAWCTRLAVARRERGDGDHYGIVRRVDDHLVGCLWTARTDWAAGSTEVMFAIGSEMRGYGIAAEAVDALAVALLLEHELQRIELRVAAGNAAAKRVAEKAGFTYEGLLRNAGYVPSGRVDVESWSLVAADLRRSAPH